MTQSLPRSPVSPFPAAKGFPATTDSPPSSPGADEESQADEDGFSRAHVTRMSSHSPPPPSRRPAPPLVTSSQASKGESVALRGRVGGSLSKQTVRANEVTLVSGDLSETEPTSLSQLQSTLRERVASIPMVEDQLMQPPGSKKMAELSPEKMAELSPMVQLAARKTAKAIVATVSRANDQPPPPPPPPWPCTNTTHQHHPPTPPTIATATRR